MEIQHCVQAFHKYRDSNTCTVHVPSDHVSLRTINIYMYDHNRSNSIPLKNDYTKKKISDMNSQLVMAFWHVHVHGETEALGLPMPRITLSCITIMIFIHTDARNRLYHLRLCAGIEKKKTLQLNQSLRIKGWVKTATSPEQYNKCIMPCWLATLPICKGSRRLLSRSCFLRRVRIVIKRF